MFATLADTLRYKVTRGNMGKYQFVGSQPRKVILTTFIQIFLTVSFYSRKFIIALHPPFKMVRKLERKMADGQ